MDMWPTKRLAIVFWLYFVGGLFLVSLALYFIVIAGIAVPSGASAPLFISATLIAIGYYIWSVVAVWKSAENVNWKPWGYLARLAVLVPVIFEIYALASSLI